MSLYTPVNVFMHAVQELNIIHGDQVINSDRQRRETLHRHPFHHRLTRIFLQILLILETQTVTSNQNLYVLPIDLDCELDVELLSSSTFISSIKPLTVYL